MTWRGVLFVDEAGPHEFFGGAHVADKPHHDVLGFVVDPHAAFPGAHAREGERPEADRARGRRFRVTLRRGQKTWIVLAHDWPGEEGRDGRSSPLPLKRGAYEITIELCRDAPEVDAEGHLHALRTGFELAYRGPDTDGRVVPLPLHRLFVADKDGPLDAGMGETVPAPVKQLLAGLYVSSLRDIRRTYQRAFKALLFARRFGLGAAPFADYAQSELGFLLDHPDCFLGMAFSGSVGAWTTHRADFDPNFLPVRDPYGAVPGDDRAQPSIERQRALFDTWERVFDYAALRRDVKAATGQPVWTLFDEAAANPGEAPAQLLRHLGINATYAPLVLAYSSGYAITAADLQDERWPIRIWRAHAWLHRLEHDFTFADVRAAKLDRWAADDPGASGGNDNLVQVVTDGCLRSGAPRRYDDLRRLNDGLRERARRALVGYLCGPSGGKATSPRELGEALLIDVDVGLPERASRIEDAVSTVQAFVRRARLGLEPSWTPSPGFMLLWDRRFATFHTWQAWKRRTVYRENWIEWDELDRARRTEAFRFLERELCRATLTVPDPGGMTYWTSARPPEHPGLHLLQAREPSTLRLLPDQPEALGLRGTPERSARRSWLASIPGITTPPRVGEGDEGTRIAASAPPTPTPTGASKGKLPFWIEAAVRLGTRFLRVAAAAVPPASNPFAPRRAAECGGSCLACGRRHEAVVDELYFWLVDARTFSTNHTDAHGNNPAVQDADANWDDDPGEQNGDLPKLLSWPTQPSVFLMWARMHDGELQQPRRSTRALPLDADLGQPAALELVGRKLDSLYFAVQGATPAPVGYPKSPLPGFRYDLATDAAVVLPQITPDPPLQPVAYGLAAYPYFAYFVPGAPLAPLSLFSESVAVARTLRAHCRFEAALAWYRGFFDPLHADVRWCWESVPAPAPTPILPAPTPKPLPGTNPLGNLDLHEAPRTLTVAAAQQPGGACCRYSAVTDDGARRRAVTLDTLETLLAWGDVTMRDRAPEAFEQARLLFDTAAKILGPRPPTVLDEPLAHAPPPTVVGLGTVDIGVPLNPRLVALYDRTADRLASIHASLDARRLRNGRPHEDMPHWIGDRAHELPWRREDVGCGTGVCHDDPCADDACCPPSPYRFAFLVQKATELANEVRTFGTALLGAFEKGDVEFLGYVRADHERRLTERALAIREDAWRAADWDVQALKKAKQHAQSQLQYYAGLLAAGLNNGEVDYRNLTQSALGALGAATVSETAATVAGPIPDLFIGTSILSWEPLGTKLAGVFQGIAQVSITTAQILSTNASLQLTEAGWTRRAAEWLHQVDLFTIEIDQIERQILAAERRRDSALHDLNNTRLQGEDAREVLDILRDKLTSHALYLYLQRETAALHREMYDLALCAARQAERAFNVERGYTARRFVPGEAWRDLREGLLAGERLITALRHMDKSYADENVREYELVKHVSLRQLLPLPFLRLKLTGACEIELPEWLFDLDYPGHYMRRIKSVALTIPCVVGPYTGVHCRLTLLSSTTRIVPWLRAPAAPCCKDAPTPSLPPATDCGADAQRVAPDDGDLRDRTGYEAQPDDVRIVRRYAAREAIATSSGQNDAGVFELNFRDDRYLPFELEGAVSRWRVELPPENNYFDLASLTDVIVHLSYTAREGGDVLRRAASETADRRVPDAGRRLFDAEQDMPEAWRRFQEDQSPRRSLDLLLRRDRFMFLPGRRDLSIVRIDVFFEAPDAEPGAHRRVELVLGRELDRAQPDHGTGREHEIVCVAGDAWPHLFHGALDVCIGPLAYDAPIALGTLRFDASWGHVRHLYVLCGYEAPRRRRRG